MASGRRRRSRASISSDALFGYLIPLFFILLATYQEIHDDRVDKYVIGAILVFGLGALGWRIDSMFEKYVEAKSLAAKARPRDDHEEDQ